MTNAKQTAMSFYGLTEWPPSHMREHPYPDCRGYACEILRAEGMTLEDIAMEVGFYCQKSVRDALSRREAVRLKEMGHMKALVHCIERLNPISGNQWH